MDTASIDRTKPVFGKLKDAPRSSSTGQKVAVEREARTKGNQAG